MKGNVCPMGGSMGSGGMWHTNFGGTAGMAGCNIGGGGPMGNSCNMGPMGNFGSGCNMGSGYGQGGGGMGQGGSVMNNMGQGGERLEILIFSSQFIFEICQFIVIIPKLFTLFLASIWH